jgi:O-antigen ligase
MMTAIKNEQLVKYSYWLLVCVTLAVTPNLSFDPINAPKYFILVLGTSILLLLQFNVLKTEPKRKLNLAFWLILVFISSLFISLFSSHAPYQTSLFGVSGRNTGVITYICLAFLMYIFYYNSNSNLMEKTVSALTHLGLILSIYGIMQANDLEIFPYGTSYGSSVFGTFGNSNFLSGFLGIAGSAAGILLLDINQKKSRRAYYFLTLVSCVLTIWLSDSQQGLLSLAAGVGIGFVLLLYSKRNYLLALSGIFVYISAGVLAISSIFEKGPFTNLIYQSSLGIRREYWYAALQVIKNHPITGIGFDNFGSYYRQNRSLEMAVKNPDVVTDSPHNIFLDLAAGGGIFTLIAYLSLLALALYSVYKVCIEKKSNDIVFNSLVAALCAYLVQGSISINNLGLAIWGWVIPGLIIGYRFRDSLKRLEANSKGLPNVSKVRTRIHLVTYSVPLLLGLASFPPFLSSVQFYSTLKTGNVQEIISSAHLFPSDLNRYIYVATTMKNNGLDGEAYEVIKEGLQLFPDSFELWRLDSELPSNYQVGAPFLQMKRLDPLNPNLK